MKQAISLSVDDEIYAKYRIFCRERGFNLSRQVEMFMEKQLKWQKE